METTISHAPFRDPLGGDSWQPSPASRRRDARSRILRTLRDGEASIDRALLELDAIVKRFPLVEHAGVNGVRRQLDAERQKLLLRADLDLERLAFAPDVPVSREHLLACAQWHEDRGNITAAAKWFEQADDA